MKKNCHFLIETFELISGGGHWSVAVVTVQGAPPSDTNKLTSGGAHGAHGPHGTNDSTGTIMMDRSEEEEEER